MVETSLYLILILTLSCHFFSNPCYSETTDTLQQGQEFKDWDELISSNGVFSLRFFSFGTTISPYLGIFYHRQHDTHTYRSLDSASYHLYEFRLNPVWVANRNDPIPDIDGKLIIDVHGKLTILSRGGTVVDLFTPIPETRHASARLLDSGNFVLQELYSNGSLKRVIWQSFDYPTDTLLPGMKLGIDLKTGHRWSLTSWASDQLPAQGSFTLKGDHNGTDQLVILRRGNIHWRSGPWKNGQFENTNLRSSGPDVHLYYIFNETEQSFTYITRTYNSFPALRLYADGRLKGSALNIEAQCISIDASGPGCAEYEFEDLNCRKYFYIYRRGSLQSYILKDEYEYDESYNLTLYDCQRICWSNCSCVVFTYAAENRVGCKTYGQMIYNPAEAAKLQQGDYYGIFDQEIDRMTIKKKKKLKRMKEWSWLTIGIGSLPLLLSCYFIYKKFHVRGFFVNKLGQAKEIQNLLLHKLRRFYNDIWTDKKTNIELRYFTFQSILSATNNFSSSNKLGQGGFGAVYKGKLADGQEVAVKRLSRNSTQGVQEFKNETELIVKLQHTNLVRLLGCCIEKQEKILVYEYMANNSLDFFLFDPRKNGLLDWNNRFVIIDGIAQGLVYLHKFSRLKVVHRDLKASNILLDDYLKPKISDFGMAKLFGINESEANTGRLVGTRGYMPPEYMRVGAVSTKTDVFSFGVLLLEIISSKMNHGSYDLEHPLNLLGLTWELWNEGRGLELMDPVLEDSCIPKEVMTCIHVGLLCVQDHAMDRPIMSEVISMLTNENMHLPEPKQPAFYIERHGAEKARDDNLGNGSVNGQSISIVEAR